MQDLIHVPTPEDGGYVCAGCQLRLPIDSVISTGGIKLVDVGGQHQIFHPYGPSDIRSAVACTNPAAKKAAQEASLVASMEIIVETPELAPGEELKPAERSDEFTRRVRGNSLQGFWALREATRLGGPNE